MIIRKFILFTLVLLIANLASGQTTEELQKNLDEKKAALAAAKSSVKTLEGEIAGIKKQLIVYPQWTIGALGTIGANFSRFNNWLGTDNIDAQSSAFGFTGNAFANLLEKKYFWRNGLNLNIAQTKLIPDPSLPEADDIGFETTADAINLTSLFGWKINDQWAISSLAEYRSTFLNNFNNPGYLDVGAGATWTPIQNLVVVFHPLNYNFVFADDDFDFSSSLGCKVVADYTQTLPRGIAWKSNFSGFVSYEDAGNLSNWTWINGLNATIWKGLGVGFEFGLRRNRQESYNRFIATSGADPEMVSISDFDDSTNDGDNPLQTYWLLGLTYSISR
ncbi:MAG: DUF3078 domain-containing protein [Bacteroidota bacterium]